MVWCNCRSQCYLQLGGCFQWVVYVVCVCVFLGVDLVLHMLVKCPFMLHLLHTRFRDLLHSSFMSLCSTTSRTVTVLQMVIVVRGISVRVPISAFGWCWWSWESFSIFVFLLGDVTDAITAVSMSCRLGLVTFLDRFGIVISSFGGSSYFRYSV